MRAAPMFAALVLAATPAATPAAAGPAGVWTCDMRSFSQLGLPDHRHVFTLQLDPEGSARAAGTVSGGTHAAPEIFATDGARWSIGNQGQVVVRETEASYWGGTDFYFEATPAGDSRMVLEMWSRGMFRADAECSRAG